MDFLYHWLESGNAPVVSALILGLMTAISPCPLATNITAIGYISKDIENRNRIFFNGLWYTLGRIISYTALGVMIYFGASAVQVGKFFQMHGEKFLGPLLIVVGVLMFDFINFRLFGSGKISVRIQEKLRKNNWWSALLLGAVFALAFCPYSGLLYFTMLIPLTVASPSGLFLPVFYAIATALPVIIIAWLLAFSLSSLGSFYNKIKIFEKWFRRVVAVIFIVVGGYFIYTYYLA